MREAGLPSTLSVPGILRVPGLYLYLPFMIQERQGVCHNDDLMSEWSLRRRDVSRVPLL